MLHFLSYRGKWLPHKKKTKKAAVYPALLSILLCMVCLVGTTWAWFTGNQKVDIQPIEAAKWSLTEVTVYQLAPQADEEAQAAQTPVAVTPVEYGYTFTAAANTRYQVMATVDKTAQTGFLRIETADGAYYTTASDPVFTICLSQSGEVKILAFWGADHQNASPMPESMVIGNGQEEAKAVCTCTTKCTEANSDCPVCKDNIAGCTGTAGDPTEETGNTEPTNAPTEPTETTEPETEPTTESTESTQATEQPDTEPSAEPTDGTEATVPEPPSESEATAEQSETEP